VATVKRGLRRIGTDLGLMGFSHYSFRHFMADQVKKLFRNVPRELRSLWMGHVVRDGSRTTSNYEPDHLDGLTDVALATDCVIGLISAADSYLLLTKAKLRAIGARAIPKTIKNQRLHGGRARDRMRFFA
jgi:hypothetical protein